MNLILKIVMILFIFLVFDRVLLFFERRYYAKHGTFLLPNYDTAPEDLKLEKPKESEKK